MAITDEIAALLKQQSNQPTPQIQQPAQPSTWVQDLIDQHTQAGTGRIKRNPVGFQFKRDPFDPSTYYNQLGQYRDISRAATAVVNQEVANREAAQQKADMAASQKAMQDALRGVNPNYTYSNGSSGGNFGNGTSKKYHLRGISSNAAGAADYWGSKYGIKTIYGLGPGSVPGSDHPKGLAIDLMINNTKNGHARGTSLANDLIQHYKAWNIKYVIWNRYIWHPGRGWQPYHGPSPHTDHVHVSFNK